MLHLLCLQLSTGFLSPPEPALPPRKALEKCCESPFTRDTPSCVLPQGTAPAVEELCGSADLSLAASCSSEVSGRWGALLGSAASWVAPPPHTVSCVSASQEGSRSPFLLPVEMSPWQAPEQQPGACGLGCRPCRQGQILSWCKLVQTGVASLMVTQASCRAGPSLSVRWPGSARVPGCW